MPSTGSHEQCRVSEQGARLSTEGSNAAVLTPSEIQIASDQWMQFFDKNTDWCGFAAIIISHMSYEYYIYIYNIYDTCLT